MWDSATALPWPSTRPRRPSATPAPTPWSSPRGTTSGPGLAALKAGKHVFVEKPLCLNLDELRAIARQVDTMAAAGTLPLLQVGFNRRFSRPARCASTSGTTPVR